MTVPKNRLLDLEPGIGQVASTVRFQVLDRDLQIIGTITPIAAGTMTANTTGTNKRTLNGVNFDAYALNEINPFVDRIKPIWVLEDGTEWPLGVFVFTHVINRLGTYVDVMETTLVDQDFVLTQGTRSTFNVPVNGSVVTAVEDILSQVRITTSMIPTTSMAQIGDALTWPAGTSRLKILQDLCVFGGWLPPFFDNDGTLHIQYPPRMDADPPDHIYWSDDSRVLRASITESDNLLDAPNVYIVTGSGPSNGPVYAATQVAADLPFSVENRRFEIVSITKPQGITTSAQAEQMANTLAASAKAGFKNIDFQGFADPRHDLFQTVQWDGAMYRETGWSLTLKPGGLHTHKLVQGGFPISG